MCTRSTVERARTHPALLLLLLSLWWLSPMVQHNTKARYVSHPHNLSLIHFKVILPSLSLSRNCVSMPHHRSVGTSRYPTQVACPTLRSIICINSVKMWHSKIGRSQWPRGLRRESTAARLLGLGFESRRGHGRLSLVSVVCCQVQIYASGWSPILNSLLSVVCLSSWGTRGPLRAFAPWIRKLNHKGPKFFPLREGSV